MSAIHPIKKMLCAAALFGTLAIAQPAVADGDIVCSAGPRENWQPIAKLRKEAWLEG